MEPAVARLLERMTGADRVAPSDIAVLTGSSSSPLRREGFSGRCPIERPVVILADLGGIDAAELPAMMCVGVSRTRAPLATGVARMSLAGRVADLEQQMHSLERRLDGLDVQLVQFRDEMRVELSGTRHEMHALHEESLAALAATKLEHQRGADVATGLSGRSSTWRRRHSARGAGSTKRAPSSFPSE